MVMWALVHSPILRHSPSSSQDEPCSRLELQNTPQGGGGKEGTPGGHYCASRTPTTTLVNAKEWVRTKTFHEALESPPTTKKKNDAIVVWMIFNHAVPYGRSPYEFNQAASDPFLHSKKKKIIDSSSAHRQAGKDKNLQRLKRHSEQWKTSKKKKTSDPLRPPLR